MRTEEEKYKEIFKKKHENAHSGMKLSDITVKYRMFKCNTALNNTQKAEYHYKKIHLLPKGPLSLKKREIIAVNTSLEFKIQDLTAFQTLGPSKQATQLDRVYTHVIARGVFEAGSGRNDAALQRSRSTDFLNGMKNACSPHF